MKINNMIIIKDDEGVEEPCPFCGGKNIHLVDDGLNCYLCCDDCEAQGPKAISFWFTLEDDESPDEQNPWILWNERSEEK